MMADVIIFQVNTHPVDIAHKLDLLAYGIFFWNWQSQVAADMHGLIRRVDEEHNLLNMPLANLLPTRLSQWSFDIGARSSIPE